MQSCMQIMLATDDVQLSSNTEDATQEAKSVLVISWVVTLTGKVSNYPDNAIRKLSSKAAIWYMHQEKGQGGSETKLWCCCFFGNIVPPLL